MKKILFTVVLTFGVFHQVAADVTCRGIIRNINTYHNDEKLYILLDTTSHYAALEAQMSKTIALTAFATSKKVNFHITGAGITSCSGGPNSNSWGNGTLINHYLSVDK